MADLELVVEGPDGSRVIGFPAETFVIGSDAACLVRFARTLVQARHAEVVRDGTGLWRIRPALASGSVMVNGEAVLDRPLAPGDRLRIGGVTLLVRAVDGADASQSKTVPPEGPRPPDTASAPTAALPARMLALAEGTVIERRYRIQARIAVGGMGEVYRAEHVELQRTVALKVMLPDMTGDEDFASRFRREAIASSRIGHQNIIDIIDFGRTDEGRFYFVMEFLDGFTLLKQLRADGAFAPQRLVHVGLQAARALAAAHAVGIIHRDLKPENIMLLQRPGHPDVVKLLDFGIAKVPTGARNLTAAGVVMGTPQYMAPEQATAGVVDARSDVYQLGLIFHELLRGQRTFTGNTGLELMAQQVEATPPPLGPQVPKVLERLVMQMLAKDPAARPASMDAVVAVLETVAAFPTPAAMTVLAPAPEAATQLVPQVLPPTAALPAVQPPPRPSAPTRVDKAVKPVGTSPAPRPVPVSRPSEDDLAAVRSMKKERWPLVVALGALVLAAVAGGAALLRDDPTVAPAPDVQTPAPPPTPAPPAAPEEVAVRFETEPPGAEVFEGELLLGNTPVALKRPRGGLADLRFEAKGYEPLTRKVRFEANTAMRFTLEKRKTAPRPKPEAPLKDLPF